MEDTAVSNGTAYITATAENGEEAVCKVTVVDLSSVSLTELMDAKTYRSGSTSLPYRIYYPSDYDSGTEKQYPVLLFLHGAGERGNDNAKQVTSNEGLMRQMIQRDDCLVIAPQCPDDAQWVNTDWSLGSYDSESNTASEYLNAAQSLLESLMRGGSIDATRVWVAGISMGGYGTWNLIMNEPDLFAAAIPMCGGGDPDKAAELMDLPIWTFHGDADDVVPVSGTQEMVAAIEAAGGTHILYTEYAGAGHVDCWEYAYAEEKLLPWLYAQQRDHAVKSDLPQIYITVTDPDYGAFDLVKGMAYVDCTIEVYDPSGEFDTLVDEGSTIKVRGNTTASGAKKPFNIKLSSKTDILGMGKGKKWSLLANMYDKTLMRNKLVFDFAEDVGLDYVPASRTVDVWLDGVYNGTYTICEPVEAGSTRVDIDTDSGEYLFEREKSRWEEGAVYMTTQRYGLRFVMCDPEELTDEQMAEMEARLKAVEDAIATNDIETISQYLDLESFVDMYIVEEYFKDVDADYSSAKYYFKEGILYCGPVWDFDLAAGNCSNSDYPSYNNVGGSGVSYEGFYADEAIWFEYLLKNEDFFHAVKERYAELQPIIVNLYEDNELGTNRIDQMLEECGESFEENWKVWSVTSKDSSAERIPDDTHEENVAYLRNWLRQRNAWMLETYGLTNEIRVVENPLGRVALSQETAAAGQTIRVDVTTEDSQAVVKAISVTADGTAVECSRVTYVQNGDGTTTYRGTFIMPDGAVQVSVEYLQIRLQELLDARKAEEWINAIGQVTQESLPAIEGARDAYDALSPQAKTLVSNYAVLTAAEHAYAELAVEAAQKNAEAAQTAAEAAEQAAQEATEAAKKAAESAGEDQSLAQKAAAAADEAAQAAQAARSAAEKAQEEAEMAKKAAQTGDASAAAKAGEAAQTAADAARTHQQIAQIKAEMAAVLLRTQDDLNSAAAAALACARCEALLNLQTLKAERVGCSLNEEKRELLLAEAEKAVRLAESTEEIEALMVQLDEALTPLSGGCPGAQYTDVQPQAWYHGGIDFVLAGGYMNGMGDGTFAPGANLTRAQIVTILYRIAGSPNTAGMENPFGDVGADSWYTDAILWAANHGLVKGTSTTTFEPNADVTREQIVTILYRFDGAQAVAEDNLAGFADVEAVGDYAVEAMNWAVANQIISGVPAGDGTLLQPAATATRAQIAAIIMRYLSE